MLALLVVPITYLVVANVWLATSAHALARKKPEKFQADWTFAYTVWPGRVSFFNLEMRGRNRSTTWYASLDRGSGSIALEDLFTRVARIEDLRGTGFRFRVRPRVDKPLPEDADPEDVPPPPELEDPEEQEVRGLPPLLPPIPGFEGLGEPIKGTKPPWTIEIEHFDLADVEEIWLERYRYEADGESGRVQGSLLLRLRRSVELPGFDLELGPGKLEVKDHKLAQLSKGRAAGVMLPFTTRRYRIFELTRYSKAEIELEATDSDLSALQYYLRGSPIELGGQGRVAAHVFLDRGVLKQGSELSVTEAELRLAYLSYWGAGKGAARVEVGGRSRPGDPQPQENGPDVARMAARLDTFELGVLGTKAAHLRGKGLEIDVFSETLDLSVDRPQLEGEIRMPVTEVPDFRVYNALWPPSFPFELRHGKAQLQSRLHFDTTATSHRVDGTVLLTAHAVRAALLNNEFVADLRLDAVLKSEDIKSRDFEIGGTRFEISALEGLWKPETHGWWAKVAIPRGQLRLEEPRAFELQLEADLQDSSPLVAALLTKKPSFEWMSGLLTVHDLHLETQVALRNRNFGLRKLRLEGAGNLAVEGELLLADKKGDGAFHIQYGPLATAVRLTPEGGREWKLVRTRHAFEIWLDELRGGGEEK